MSLDDGSVKDVNLLDLGQGFLSDPLLVSILDEVDGEILEHEEKLLGLSRCEDLANIAIDFSFVDSSVNVQVLSGLDHDFVLAIDHKNHIVRRALAMDQFSLLWSNGFAG